jgi:cytochrome c551/c552
MLAARVRRGGAGPRLVTRRVEGPVVPGSSVVGLLSTPFLVRGDASATPPGDWTAEGPSYYHHVIEPLFRRHCWDCHHPSTEMAGGLRLDIPQGWRLGGDSGSAVVVGDPERSLLYDAISYDLPHLQMPPDGPLSDDERRAIFDWIAAGAAGGDSDAASDLPATESQPIGDGPPVGGVAGLPLERAQQHWAYRSPEALPPPIAWPPQQTPHPTAGWVDAWINSRLAQAGLEPAPRLPRQQLIRRLYFDLLGVPPSLDQVEAFVEDRDPDAYTRLVDRLLASPQLGERLARRWMDVARYAESLTLRGFVLPQVWRYRDYLVDAFNADHPLDSMVVEQLAGDLLPAVDAAAARRQAVATTFLLLGNTNLEQQDKRQLEMDVIDEQLDVIGTAFLGQTLGCARCHDHKFDPIPTADYYQLAGIFDSIQVLEHGNVSKWLELELPGADPSDPAPRRMGLKERDVPRQTPIHVRGSVHQLGETVPRGFLRLVSLEVPQPGESGSGRAELAQWLVHPDQPLTPRVLANRLWQWVMGEGLVVTVDNFGTTGQPPAHLELLDQLALQLVSDGWSGKALLRRIVLSEAYQRDGYADDTHLGYRVDPDNRLLWRGHLRRLDIETLRDTLLEVAGELDRQLGGTLIPAGRTSDYGLTVESHRRSVYLPVLRNAIPEAWAAFDFANPSFSVGRRSRTTQPTQSLWLLGDAWVEQRAISAAGRILDAASLSAESLSAESLSAESLSAASPDGDATWSELVRHAHLHLLGREPTPDELEVCLDQLEAARAEAVPAQEQSGGEEASERLGLLVELVQALVASLEFRYSP